MPEPVAPPPADEFGAFNQPRTLNRWLDVNPVHRLTRAETFITIPAFSIVSQKITDYSYIVGAFNFEAPNNFVLKNWATTLLNNFTLAIMWEEEAATSDVNPLRTVHRYILWPSSYTTLFYFDFPLYRGQKIGKNFRFEIWSSYNMSRCDLAAAATFYTSKLRDQDYMFVDDTTLALPSALITDFFADENAPASHIFALPLTFPANSIPTLN